MGIAVMNSITSQRKSCLLCLKGTSKWQVLCSVQAAVQDCFVNSYHSSGICKRILSSRKSHFLIDHSTQKSLGCESLPHHLHFQAIPVHRIPSSHFAASSFIYLFIFLNPGSFFPLLLFLCPWQCPSPLPHRGSPSCFVLPQTANYSVSHIRNKNLLTYGLVTLVDFLLPCSHCLDLFFSGYYKIDFSFIKEEKDVRDSKSSSL